MTESSFSSGFGGALGVLLALAVVFVGLPIMGMFLLCGGCVTLTGGAASVQARLDEEERVRAAAQSPGELTVDAADDPFIQPEEPAIPEPPKPFVEMVTLENFDAVTVDMAYSEVVSLLGEPSETLSDSVVGKGTVFEATTQVYRWQCRDSAGNCTVTIRNGKVLAKSQAGL